MNRCSLACRNAVLLLLAVFVSHVMGQDNKDALNAQRSTRLNNMHEQAAEFRFTRESTRRAAKLKPVPLFRYADPPRGFIDATLWLWESNGAPIAIAKVEDCRLAGKLPQWQFCLASLANEKITVVGPGPRNWNATKAGVEFRRLDGTPPPSKSEAGRLRQMKTIVKGFKAEMGSVTLDQSQQLAPQVKPLHRYSAKEQRIKDATVFAFGANGTNPDLLIVIALKQLPDSDQLAWHYEVVGMSADRLIVRRDEQIVWSRRLKVGDDPVFDTWFYYQVVRSRP